MNRLPLWHCTACDHWSFPERRRCPACGADALQCETVAAEGVVAEATVVRKAAGVAPGAVRHLATVRLELGPTVLARSESALEPGERVALAHHQGGAVWAHTVTPEGA